MSVSVVVPIYNEEENVPRLYKELYEVLAELDRAYEIIFVNDGSRDSSAARLAELAEANPQVRVIEFAHNFGQTAAMSAGIQHARNEVIITLDGDLQNDPADIPALLSKIDEGYDLVQGWRKDRQDRFLDRRLPSIIANKIISYTTNFPVHDLGCTLKAFKREIGQKLPLYGEMHRFIPILAHWRGAKCTEMVTRHRSRRFGTSKYGLSRIFRVLLDLMTVRYLTHHLFSPMRLFGSLGLLSWLLGFGTFAATGLMKYLSGVDMTGNPLLLLSVGAILTGVQFLSLGLLAELGTRIYFQGQSSPPLVIYNTLNMDSGETADTLPLSRSA